MCRHPEIQALRPKKNEALWVPTQEQLQTLLQQKLPYPDSAIFRKTADGWEYQTRLREWADDYGTYIDTQRSFSAESPQLVLLQALSAALGITEIWMV